MDDVGTDKIVVGISETTAVTTLANGFTDLHISGNGVSYDVIFHDGGADEMWSVLKSPSTVRFSSSRSEMTFECRSFWSADRVTISQTRRPEASTYRAVSCENKGRKHLAFRCPLSSVSWARRRVAPCGRFSLVAREFQYEQANGRR